jgi:hypothetical protein
METNSKSQIRSAAALLAAAILVSAAGHARADEGGISFWLPGGFGSLAAAPLTPGWGLGVLYYHASIAGGGDVSASRALHFRNTTTNLIVNLDAQLKGRADLVAFIPNYTFATPVLGGQLGASLMIVGGRSTADINANITGALGPIGFATTRSVSDTLSGFGDLYPQVTLRWNNGVNNYMIYGMADLPVGAYDSSRLANLGIGHWAIDGGAGYTYLNPQTGWEFSAVTGLTYNFKNPSTDYQNGIDWHLDVGWSRFITKQVQLGLVGYAYQQISGDSGSGATLGDFKSRVLGIGPQIAYLFPIGGMQGYLNLKGYKEFDAEHRADGWNVWLALSISPAAPTPPAASRLIHK